jgi:hypothetical protein
VAPDLPHRVDDVLTDFLSHLLELLIGERMQILRPVDPWQEVFGH